MSELNNDCKTAELHLIGRIQPYGALLAVDRKSGIVIAGSENIRSFLGYDAQSMLGRSCSDFLDSRYLAPGNIVEGPGGMCVPDITQDELKGKPVVVSSHVRDPVLIIEIEPSSGDTFQDHRDRLHFLQELAACATPEQAATLLLEHIVNITGFDRVMLYKFLPEWHGKVIAEINKPGIEGFLGLHFPAGDIPENARRLYTVNMQRFIANVAHADIDILGLDKDRAPDLTHAQLRAVHPVHIQYLKNIGAQSAFSVSIVVHGKLWGMVACHHMKPGSLGFRRRYLCEELARIVSLHMSGLISLETEKKRSTLQLPMSLMRTTLQSGEDISSVLNALSLRLQAAFEADSIWIQIEKESFVHGLDSEDTYLEKLHDWCGELDRQEVCHTNEIPPRLKDCPELAKHACGILFIPIGEHGFILLLRNEQVQNIKWAGKVKQNGAQEEDELTPRASFRAWVEEVRGTALPWSSIMLEAAEQLRNLLMNHFEKSGLKQMALQDNLTGLANRAMFERELQHAFGLSNDRDAIISLLMLDLDKFKEVNDTYGHGAGDELLMQVAERLRKIVRGRDVISRLGGDEFSIILYHFSNIDEVEVVAGRIADALQQPFQLKDAEVRISASIGIAVYPGDGENREQLMKNADAALYQVKRAGRNGYRFWSGLEAAP